MKRILFLLFTCFQLSSHAQQNGWGNWATMYTDSDMKVEVQFYISNASCQGGKPFKFRTRVTGKMRSYPYFVNWKFDYKDCNGNSYFQQQGVEIGNATGGSVDGLMAESMDNRFTALALEQPFYDVAAGYAEVRNLGMNAKPLTAAEIEEKKQWEVVLINPTIENINEFKSQYPNGKYTQEAITLLAKMGVSSTPVNQKTVVQANVSSSLTISTVTDIDGNIYKTTTIGTQTWMAENLKTTKYNDGKIIRYIAEDETWFNRDRPMMCYYKNSTRNAATYGALYNWPAVNKKKLCPTGWHVPSDSEWRILTDYLGGEYRGALKLKSTSGWSKSGYDDQNGTNDVNFTAIPSGYRDGVGTFYDLGNSGRWWSASTGDLNYDDTLSAWIRGMQNHSVDRFCTRLNNGYSVRCLKD